MRRSQRFQEEAFGCFGSACRTQEELERGSFGVHSAILGFCSLKDVRCLLLHTFASCQRNVQGITNTSRSGGKD